MITSVVIVVISVIVGGHFMVGGEYRHKGRVFVWLALALGSGVRMGLTHGLLIGVLSVVGVVVLQAIYAGILEAFGSR